MQITRGVIPSALKVLIYGPEGIGKTTLASKFPDPLFIDVEGSTKQLDVARLPDPQSWGEIIEEVKYVESSLCCKTLVIDTADWAEMLCAKALTNSGSIEDFGYGKGYVMLAEKFQSLLTELNNLIASGIHVVFTAHAQMRKFEQPDEMGAYDRWELKMQKKTAPLVKEWADMILFCNYKTHVITTPDKKKKVQGGERVMYTTHHNCWDAKNRFGLPDMIPMDFDSIAHVVGVPKTPQIPEELKALMDHDGITDEDLRMLAVSKAWVTDSEMPLFRYKKELIDFIIQNWDKVAEIAKSETIPFDEED